MKQALLYSLKVWLTTIVIGSVIMGIKIYIFYSDWWADALRNLYLVPGIGIPYGIVYFLPSWFIFGIATWYILKKDREAKLVKVYLSILAIILAIAPFATMDYHSLFVIKTGWFAGFPPDLFWTITYVGISIAGVWFYKIKSCNILDDSKSSAIS